MDHILMFLAHIATVGATVVGVVIIAGAFLIGLKMIASGRKRDRQGEQDDETEVRDVQRMYRTLGDMERRLEALETLLMERERASVERAKENPDV